MATKDYLDPRWQKKRLEILERDNFTCIICGSTEKTLHVHHKKYIRNRKVWDYDNDYLVSLCDNCHNIEHNYTDIVKDLKELINYTIKKVDSINLYKNISVLCLKMLNEIDNENVNMADEFLNKYFGEL